MNVDNGVGNDTVQDVYVDTLEINVSTPVENANVTQLQDEETTEMNNVNPSGYVHYMSTEIDDDHFLSEDLQFTQDPDYGYQI